MDVANRRQKVPSGHAQEVDGMGTITANGQICVGSASRSWGFTADRWETTSYLWRTGHEVMLSLLIVRSARRHQGVLTQLVQAIEADGMTVAVPSPLGILPRVLRRWGFHPRIEDGCAVWRRENGAEG